VFEDSGVGSAHALFISHEALFALVFILPLYLSYQKPASVRATVSFQVVWSRTAGRPALRSMKALLRYLFAQDTPKVVLFRFCRLPVSRRIRLHSSLARLRYATMSESAGHSSFKLLVIIESCRVVSFEIFKSRGKVKALCGSGKVPKVP